MKKGAREDFIPVIRARKNNPINLIPGVPAVGLSILAMLGAGCATTSPQSDRSRFLIGYTDMRCDDPRGQLYNWQTMRAQIVRADGSGRLEIGQSLVTRPGSWTQFAGWWPRPDNRAVLHCSWEAEDNYLWERAHQTFRMTEGWLVDSCLVDIQSGKVENLTAVDRVSDYNTGLSPWPADPKHATFAPLIQGIQHPFVMDMDGRNKRDLSNGPEGFTYGCKISPDGQRITYNKDYLVYVADKDGLNPRRLDLDPAHPFQFIPTWSPNGQWILFLAGEHYNCHPHLVSPDGGAVRKLADRAGYKGTMQPLKFPDFHSESSDIPAWSPDSKWVYYTAQVGQAVELMRVSLAGKIEQLTHSPPGTANYHPSLSPDGRLILFGSNRDGAGAQYVANADGSDLRAVTTPAPGRVQMHGHWGPTTNRR